MAKIIAVLFLTILFAVAFGGAQQADTSETYRDWLGSGPIYRYGDVILPYLPYYQYYYPWSYKGPYPYYYYQPYFVQGYPASVWWIGTHEGLQKTIDIARSGSSMRIYSNGFWQTP